MDEKGKAFVYTSARCDFCYIMPDDSMIVSRIYKGDLLCFRAADTVENGRIAAVMVNGAGPYVRTVQMVNPDTVLLAARSFAPVSAADGVYHAADVQIVGVLVESHHPFVCPVTI